MIIVFFFQLTISCTAIHFGKTRPFFAAGTGKDMKKWWFNWNLSWVHHYVAKDISSWAIVYFKVVTVMWKMLILKLLRVLARSPINPWNIEQVPWPWIEITIFRSICQVTRSLNCVWVEHISTPKSFRRVTLMTRKNQSRSKHVQDYFITICRRFDWKL